MTVPAMSPPPSRRLNTGLLVLPDTPAWRTRRATATIREELATSDPALRMCNRGLSPEFDAVQQAVMSTFPDGGATNVTFRLVASASTNVALVVVRLVVDVYRA